MLKKNLILLLLTFCSFHSVTAQTLIQTRTYPKNFFRFPTDLPPSSAGTFGELRANHFHSGLDFRTNQRTGYPIYAAFDGYISRLRVQVGGFGNAVYISHPNGFTSVYAHLDRVSPVLAKTVKDYQYQKEIYDVDFLLQPLQIPIKKGEFIAWSGNTGASAGPHLHFEIRDSQTEETINPQLFGLKIPDNIPPSISALYVYRLNGEPFSEKTPKQYFQVMGTGGNYHLPKITSISLSGEVGFGISTNDVNTGSTNRNGIYSIELVLDSISVYAFASERFSFDQTRALNAHIDYPAFLTSKRWIQKSFVEPGSKITVYPILVNRGLINFNDDAVHKLEYIIRDASGNTSRLKFKVKSAATPAIKQIAKTTGTLFKYDQKNEFSNEQVKVIIPEGILYSNLDFTYSVLPRKPGSFSEVHRIHNPFTPIHDNFQLWIKPDSTIGHLGKKAVIINTGRASQGGIYEDGFVKTTVRSFGDYYVTVDTLPPIITTLNITNDKNMAQTGKILMKASDNLSGIKSYNGHIDGHWVLMELDYKTRIMSYTFDERVKPGKHVFELVVVDYKNNESKFTANFYR
ncbi:MAG: M23 family metallopeptidase [Sphingobacteriaceae bacterium]